MEKKLRLEAELNEDNKDITVEKIPNAKVKVLFGGIFSAEESSHIMDLNI